MIQGGSQESRDIQKRRYRQRKDDLHSPAILSRWRSVTGTSDECIADDRADCMLNPKHVPSILYNLSLSTPFRHGSGFA